LAVLVVALSFGLASQPMSAQADGITSGTADYTLTTTTGLAAPTGPPPGTPSVTLNSTLTNGSETVSLPSSSGVAAGYEVTGTGIPAGTTVSQINASSNQLTLSQNATVTGSESVVYTPPISPQVVALIEPTGNLTVATGGVVTPPTSATQGPLTILANSTGFKSTGVYDFLATKEVNGQTVQALGLSFYGQGLAANGILNFSLNVANQSSPPQLLSQTAGVTITLTKATSSPSNQSNSGSTSEVPEPISLLLWSVLAGAGLLRAGAMRRWNRVALGV
jgi:hypothetical protein